MPSLLCKGLYLIKSSEPDRPQQTLWSDARTGGVDHVSQGLAGVSAQLLSAIIRGSKVPGRVVPRQFLVFLFSTMLGRLFALAACALPLVSALPKIHAKGKYLYDESGNRFYIKVRVGNHAMVWADVVVL